VNIPLSFIDSAQAVLAAVVARSIWMNEADGQSENNARMVTA